MAKNKMAEMVVTNMYPILCDVVNFLHPTMKPIIILGNQQAKKKKTEKPTKLKISAPPCEIHPLPSGGLNINATKDSNVAVIAAKNVYRKICMIYYRPFQGVLTRSKDFSPLSRFCFGSNSIFLKLGVKFIFCLLLDK